MRAFTLVACAATLGTFLASGSASAQPRAEDQATARVLFEQARTLLKNGDYEKACHTLEAASALYESPGILLNLGDCYEKIGRSASAWTEFGQAATAAARAGRNDQVTEARRRQSAVEPKLARLTIRVSGQPGNVAIKRDDTDLAPAAWGEAFPVDPGTHEIHAEAPGHQPWTLTVTVTIPGQTIAVDVPELQAAPSPPAESGASTTTGPTAAFAEAPPERPRSHALSWALIGGGAAVAVAGGVLWGLGVSQAHDARSQPAGNPTELASATSKYDSARTLYAIGIGGVAVGGAAAVVGAVLWTTGRGKSRPAIGSIGASPWVASSGAGLRLDGHW